MSRKKGRKRLGLGSNCDREGRGGTEGEREGGRERFVCRLDCKYLFDRQIDWGSMVYSRRTIELVLLV